MEDNNNKPPLEGVLQVGEATPTDIYSKNGLLLLKKGHYILHEDQRERLIRMGTPHAASQLPPVEHDPVRLSRDFSPFEEIQYAERHLDYILGAGLEVQQFEPRVRALASRLLALTEQAADGMLASMLLVPLRNYSSAHSVHVGIILAVLSRRMSLSETARSSLLCAALTMNIAIARLMDDMYHQRSPLSDAQRSLIDSHPLMSSAILRELGVEDELWHLLVQTHHEKWDGQGYPYGLNRDSIESLAHLLHLTDITAAKLVPRSYRAAMRPNMALARIFLETEASFDPQFSQLLVKELGIYPPGCFVRLASNEMGVVLSRRERANEPCIAVLRGSDGTPYNKPQLRESSQPEHRILASIEQKEIGIRPQYLAKLWQRNAGNVRHLR